jgi:hypothetical protein
MILIAGDSWGCGEWSNSYSILHTGLEQYLIDDGNKVVNLSRGGASNLDAANRIETFLDIKNKLNIEKIETILVFQTEWFRDLDSIRYLYPLNKDEYLNFVFNKEYLNIDKCISSWYYRLSNIGKKYSVKIGIIGGASDTVFLSKFTEEYPNVFIACQSLTNLIVNNNSYIDNPVFGVNLNRFLKLTKNANIMSNIIKDIDKSNQRLNTWKKFPKYFFPDGCHPNRLGHKILFDFLKSTNVV